MKLMTCEPNEDAITALLDDIGIEEVEVRDAAREWARGRIVEEPGAEFSALQHEVQCFAHGFEAARAAI